MAYQELENVTSLTQLFVYPATVMPHFYSLMLFSLFVVVLSASYFSQRRLTGRGDFLASFVVASWFISVIASVLYIIPGMIATTTLLLCIGVSVISIIFLLLSRN
jgi:hypothetical protein